MTSPNPLAASAPAEPSGFFNAGTGGAIGEWREWYRSGKLAEYSLINKYGELIHLQRWDEEGDLVEENRSGVARGL